MPRGKDAVALKTACLTTIAHNFERLWAYNFEQHLSDIPRLLFVIGPFDNLPGGLCQDVLQTLMQQRILRRSHLQLLLLPQLEQIDFSSGATTAISAQALEILSLRCQRLTSLNLTNCSSLSPGSITQCLNSLPLLRKLILKHTKINDNVLKVIAISHPSLIHLNISGCPVTDIGASLLCGDNGDFVPACINLGKLDITATKIGLSGCSLIIHTFCKLKYINFADTFEAVALLYQSKETSGHRPANKEEQSVTLQQVHQTDLKTVKEIEQLQLQTLHATALKCASVRPESVQVACAHCCNVREIFFYQNASDRALQHLINLIHLTVLEVTSDQPGEVTFHEGLLPLLQSRGDGIISLGLYDVQDVDACMIGILCPHLQQLKFVSMYEDADFAHSYIPDKQLATIFTSLQRLTVVIGPDTTNLQQDDFLCILRNAQKIEEIHLINVQHFTDDVLTEVLTVHGFLLLKSLKIESCNNVGISSLIQLISHFNPLNLLILKQCSNVSFQDLQELHRKVKYDHLDLTIQWE